MQKIQLRREPCLDSKKDAFTYQRTAVDAIKDLKYAAIFHEQGLGKTKIAVDLMLYWLNKKELDTVLIVTKKSLVPNWVTELKAHTHMIPRILNQNSLNNFYIFNSPTRLILTHFETIISELERIKTVLELRNVGIIIDESAKIKNPESNLTKAFFELAPFFKKRVIMTGTPVANRPYDIWSQIFFLDMGASLGTDFTIFKRDTDLHNKLSVSEVKRNEFEDAISSIHNKISSFTVRETKNSGVISLPDKDYHKVLSSWEPVQFELYQNIREETKSIVVKNGIPEEDDAGDVLKRLLRLVQIASNPALIDESYTSEPGKYEALLNLVEIITDKKEKCIVWTSFVENVEWLSKRLRNFGTVKIHGKIPISDRQRYLQSFKDDADVRVLIATPASAKEGLTLTNANHAIFYDRGFSLDDYLQAQDRIHRISQTKTCHIYNLIMENSIDEWIDALLESKHLAAQLTQGDITREYYEANISYDFGTIIKEILGIGDDNNDF